MDEPPRDPRHGPSEDELPGVLGYGLRWGSSANAMVVVEAARVFSDGVMFQVGRQLRRGDLSVRAFQQLVHEDHFYASDEDRRARLRYGAVLADGQHVTDGYPFGRDSEGTGAVLMRHGGGGGGGASSYRYTDELWLHPLPPTGPLELVVQWPSLGLPEQRVALPAADMLQAAEQVTALWPD
ncbi:hypothetical protein [Curtobacterium sp. AG1037]|nr:hypothetical protein [Curtobacterium sp. AG1037]